MEREIFLSGYCKALDQGRTVALVIEDGQLTEADCAYPGCPHAPGCPLAKKIGEAIA